MTVAPALIDDGGVLGHAALDRRASAWAAALSRRFGVGPGDRVGVLAHGNVEVFALQLACAHLGAALAPLSWRLAPLELAAVVRDCKPAVLLHDAAHADVAAAIDAPRARLDSAPWVEAPPPPRVMPDPSGIAQVLYTSGTTGRPRGALITWRQIGFNNAVTRALCALDRFDRVLGLLPLFHTGGLNCLALPVLAAGGAVVVMPRFDAAAAVAAMSRHRITAVIAVPTIYEQLLDAGLSRATAPALRVLLVGGAPVTPTLLARAGEAGLALRQGYGLTEVGPNCFTFGPGDGPGADTIGRPVPGSEARLVDDRGGDVVDGEPGELWLRGPHVTAGYLGQPEATAAALDRDGWFHTGDLLRRCVGGAWQVVGRRKEMFISGGENVYPGEVEAALVAHPAVAEAAVIGVPDPRWGEVGLAAVVTRSPVTERELEAWARGRVAAYKVPRRWRLVAALPRTATGKINRAELAAEVAVAAAPAA